MKEQILHIGPDPLLSQGGRLAGKLELAVPLVYVLAVAGYPVTAVIRVLFNFEIDDKAISYLLRAAIAGSSVYVFFLLRSRRITYPGIWVLPLALFWVPYLVRIVYDTAMPDKFIATPVNVLVYAFAVTLLPMAGFFIKPSEFELGMAARGIVISLAFTCGMVLLLPQSQEFLLNTGRVGLLTLNPISLGHAAATLVILTVYQLLSTSKVVRTRRIVLGVVLVLLGVYTMMAAGSRGPASSMIAALLIMGRWIGHNIDRRMVIALVFTVLLLVPAGFLLFQQNSDLVGAAQENIVERSQLDFGDFNSYIRTTLIRDSLSQFMESPFWGSGLTERNTGEYPHNLIVEAFMATGILGGCALLFYMAVAVGACARVIKLRQQGGWVALVFVQYLVGGMFSGALWESYMFWCFAIGTIALSVSFPQRSRISVGSY